MSLLNLFLNFLSIQIVQNFFISKQYYIAISVNPTISMMSFLIEFIYFCKNNCCHQILNQKS